MTINIKSAVIVFISALAVFSSCKKQEYSLDAIKTPSSLTLTTAVAGVDADNPDGNGKGNVLITAAADNALTYKIDFGDGTNPRIIPSGNINYKYNNPGTNEYTITVNAIGTAGATSTISKKVKVFVAYEIPDVIVAALTGGSSKIWITDNDAPGHFGVSPADKFTPTSYAATPNSREPCAYDDEITFSKDANNNISMVVDNKGQSFSIGAATAFYGFGGGDACLGIDAGGTKRLIFMPATSGSAEDISTQVQFNVPGNGIVNFGTGGSMYEILSVSDTKLHLRNMGIDGNAWYQKLKVKP